MKIAMRVIDVHAQIGQREAKTAKGRMIEVEVVQAVLVGDGDGPGETKFQLNIMTDDPNVSRNLSLNNVVEVEVPVGVSPLKAL